MAASAMTHISPLVRGYDQLILDLDGCVWIGDELVDGSADAIAALREAGKRVAFATNNCWHPGEDHVAKLWGFGVQASLADVVTVGGAVQHLLAETRAGSTAYVIGTDALRRHVGDAGLKILNGTDLASRAQVVVVGGTDDVHYSQLRDAALSARRGADLLATGRDPTLPMPDGHWPGTGALLAAIETASGRTAEIVGKPSPRLFHTALDRLGAGRTLVVGDRLDSDVVGRRSGRPGCGARAERRCVRRGGSRRAGAEAGGRGPDPRRTGARRLMPRKTHHKHSSKKGYRRLLDGLAELDGVHRVATGRVKPRMGSGRPVAPISKVRRTESGLSITINTDGAIVDAYVITDRPAEVEAAIRERGWSSS